MVAHTYPQNSQYKLQLCTLLDIFLDIMAKNSRHLEGHISFATKKEHTTKKTLSPPFICILFQHLQPPQKETRRNTHLSDLPELPTSPPGERFSPRVSPTNSDKWPPKDRSNPWNSSPGPSGTEMGGLQMLIGVPRLIGLGCHGSWQPLKPRKFTCWTLNPPKKSLVQMIPLLNWVIFLVPC